MKVLHWAGRIVLGVLAAGVASGIVVGCVAADLADRTDRDFSNWCRANGGRVEFVYESSGFQDNGTGRCFEVGSSRLIRAESDWKAPQ